MIIPPRPGSLAAHAIRVLVPGGNTTPTTPLRRCAPPLACWGAGTDQQWGATTRARDRSMLQDAGPGPNPSRVTGNQLAQELPSELGGWANANGCKPRNRQRAGSAFRFRERLVKVEAEPLRWTSGQTSSACFACGRVRWWYWSVSRRIVPGRRRLVGD